MNVVFSTYKSSAVPKLKNGLKCLFRLFLTELSVHNRTFGVQGRTS